MSSIKKINKWDLKKAAKLLQLEWSESVERDLLALAGVIEKPKEDPASLKAVEEKVEINDGMLTGLAIVSNPKTTQILEVRFRKEDGEVVFETDFEPRASLEFQKRLAEIRMNDFRKQKHNNETKEK